MMCLLAMSTGWRKYILIYVDMGGVAVCTTTLYMAMTTAGTGACRTEVKGWTDSVCSRS